jgi:hypothetical protein
MAKKKTPAQHFAQLFRLFTTGATEGERTAAERKMDAWLKRHRKTRADIQSILVQAAKDDEAAQPPPPPSDPRDAASSPFNDLTFTPAGLVEGILTKYVTMPAHLACILALWICFTHVYPRCLKAAKDRARCCPALSVEAESRSAWDRRSDRRISRPRSWHHPA